MRALIIGGGGREHALAWKTARSPKIDKTYVAPGNAGTAREPGVENVALAAEDIDALLDFARRRAIDLTLVGPEAPLAAGIVDRFRAQDLPIFGPSAAAARIEASKVFCKEFMQRHGIPTAPARVFDALDPALAHLRARPLPMVVKADGLAAGKGVVVAQERDEAEAAARAMLSGDAFGDAGRQILIEDFAPGQEASFICMVDGAHALPLAGAQDYKARDDGGRGPNTGGMGAFSPAPQLDAALEREAMERVIMPAVAGLAAEGAPFTGFLYAGLMLGPDGMQVLEFNCRLGDPETQPLLARMETDLVELLERALAGALDQAAVSWDPRAALTVVMATRDYPGNYPKGAIISGLDDAAAMPDTKVFHAGTALQDNRPAANGGRVLGVTALGDALADARQKAYAACEAIDWEGAFYRGDIGAEGG